MAYTPPGQTTVDFDFSLDPSTYEIPAQTKVYFSFLQPMIWAECEEGIVLADVASEYWAGLLTASSAIATTVGFRLGLSALDGVSLADVVAAQAIYALQDSFGVGEEAGLRLQVVAALQEQAVYDDRILYIAHAMADDGLDLATDTTQAIRRVFLAAEVLGLGETSEVKVQIVASLIEALAVIDVAGFIHSLTAAETVALADDLSAALQAQCAALEEYDLADEAAGAFTIVLQADESLALDETMGVSVIVQLLAAESFAYVAKLPLGDEDYAAYVLNADSLGVTTYSNFPFNSFAEHQGRYFGLTETGLYELTGDDDDGTDIDAYVVPGLKDFGTLSAKSVPRAYLYIKNEERMVLKVRTDWQGQRKERWYELKARPEADVPQLRRVKLARGVIGVQWQFEIHNTDGGDFDLRGAEVLPVVLKRRV